MHLGEQLVDRLISYGVKYVFGCPGGQTLPLYNGIFKRSSLIEHVLMRDERSGAYAADGYARTTGRIGVCDATVGPGASNLVSALVEAYSSSVPVLAIVSDIPRRWEHRRRLGSASQGFEQRKFLEGCVKYYGRVETRDTLAETLHTCVRLATSGRPGPVVLEIPDDVFAGDAGVDDFPATPELATFPRLRPGADPAAIAEAVKRISGASRPYLVAGGGAVHARAGEVLVALAEALNCPVATTVTAKGLVSELHPLSVGVAGRFGVPMANELMAESDCVIFIGSKTGQTTTNGWTTPTLDTPVVHIDVDADEIGRSYPNTVGIFADARVGSEALLQALQGASLKSGWDLERIAKLRSEWWDGPITYRQQPVPGVLKPQDITRIMRANMAGTDNMVTDASLVSGWIAGRWQAIEAGRHVFSPRGLAGLGWGLPAAIGVNMALRSEGTPGKVVCYAGDGGWGYSMAEVETAARLKLPLVSVVINNSVLGWIKHSAERRYPDAMVSEDFIEVTYADAGKALGAEAVRVDTLEDFEAAFKKAMSDNTPRPWVIEAKSCSIETPVLEALAHTPPVTKGGY